MEDMLTQEQLAALLLHPESVIEIDPSLDVVTLCSYHKGTCLATVAVPHFQRLRELGLG